MIRNRLLDATWASQHHPEREDLARSGVPRPTSRHRYYSPSAMPHTISHSTQRLDSMVVRGGYSHMLPGSFSPAHGAAAAGLVGTEGRSPTIRGRPAGARRAKTTSRSQCSAARRRQTKNVCGVTAASASGPIHPRICPQLSCSVAISSWPELDLTRMGEALSR
jgi:hypothetical protein